MIAPQQISPIVKPLIPFPYAGAARLVTLELAVQAKLLVGVPNVYPDAHWVHTTSV